MSSNYFYMGYLFSKKPIQCKYQWSSNGDDGALIGDKYVIKLSGYNSSAEIYDKKARGLGLITPDSQIITSKSRLWKETVEVALKDVRYRWRNGEKISGIDTALLMKKINGQELTNISLDKIPKDKSVQNIFSNSAKRIYLSEIKRVRRITPFSGNELATVLIAVVCIALLV